MSQSPRLNLGQSQRLQLNMSLLSSLRLLRHDGHSLSAYLAEEAQRLPALQLGSTPAQGWLPRWSTVWQGLAQKGRGDMALGGLVAATPGLVAHALQALPRLVPDRQDQPIAIALIEALAPSGWIDRPLLQIASDTAKPLADVERVLFQLQHIEPAGLFARTLAECLRLQAKDAGQLDGVMESVLLRLDLLAAQDFTALARLADCSVVDIFTRFKQLRSFQPKPGTLFTPAASPQREPDLTAEPQGDGWKISLNRSALPTLDIDVTAEGAAEARQLLRLVEARNTTLLEVGQALLSHQRPALDHGLAALRPLKMQTLADAMGLHKSTISRVVAGAAVDTPHGTWWLRALFSPDMGADLAAGALRAQLQRLVATEDPAQPLADEDLARILSSGGVSIARRTVAKYRMQLHIPPRHRRRKS